MSTNVITQVASKAITIWDDVEAAVGKDVAKVEAAVPSLGGEVATLASDVKQGASDLLGAAGTLLGEGAKPLATLIEQGADAGLAGLTKGASVVLDPLVNSMIDMVVNMGAQALQAWALAKKAELSAVSLKSTVGMSPSASETPPLSLSSTSATSVLDT